MLSIKNMKSAVIHGDGCLHHIVKTDQVWCICPLGDSQHRTNRDLCRFPHILPNPVGQIADGLLCPLTDKSFLQIY